MDNILKKFYVKALTNASSVSSSTTNAINIPLFTFCYICSMHQQESNSNQNHFHFIFRGQPIPLMTNVCFIIIQQIPYLLQRSYLLVNFCVYQITSLHVSIKDLGGTQVKRTPQKSKISPTKKKEAVESNLQLHSNLTLYKLMQSNLSNKEKYIFHQCLVDCLVIEYSKRAYSVTVMKWCQKHFHQKLPESKFSLSQ